MITGTGASDMFTQDLEDIKGNLQATGDTETQPSSPAPRKTSRPAPKDKMAATNSKTPVQSDTQKAKAAAAKQKPVVKDMPANTTKGPATGGGGGETVSFQGLADMIANAKTDADALFILEEAFTEHAKTPDDILNAFAEFKKAKPGPVLNMKAWKARKAALAKLGGS